jgi:Uma2 family endonuclease
MPGGVPFFVYLSKHFIMETLKLDLSKRYSFADYLTWIDDKRRELIDGFINLMSPAPTRVHQKVAARVFGELWNQLSDNPCQAYFAPFDVRLPNNPDEISDEQVYTVVQPDISIICDLKKLDDKGCIGAPDFIIEIISPSTAKHDVEDKYRLYEKHGVREYWIVYPESKSISVFVLDKKGKYQLVWMFADDSKVKVNIFEGIVVDLEKVFKD